MKILWISLLALAIAGFAVGKGNFVYRSSAKPKTDKVTYSAAPAVNGFAVVELFTSEGCSSCPPAEALLRKLATEKKAHVYVLSYHVDYWDRLGWKDAFSKPEWTARQAAYVSRFRLQSAYTPQAVINGSKQFVGSSNTELYKTVDKELQETENSNLGIHAVSKGGKINVSFESAPIDNATFNIVLVQSKIASDVKRGENSGRHLEHTNVVRDMAVLKSPDRKGEINFTAPADFNAANYEVIAFIQAQNNLKIMAATKATIN